jgi:HK97 family phage portal protein
MAGVTHSGKKIDADSALELIPVYSAIQLISGAIASLPIKVYRDLPDGGRVAAPSHRAQRLMDRPTPTMAGDEWRQIMLVHLLTWGNFYAAKEFDQAGFVSALWPIHPQRVKVARKKGSDGLEYFVDDKPFDEKGLLHIRGMGDDGVLGYSPIQHARHALGMAAALEEFTSKFFQNGARPGVILRHPSRISPEAAERLRAQWSAAHGGSKNAFSTVVVEEGISVDTLTMPITDSELLGLSKLTLTQVALLYRIPPYMMGADSGGSLTYSTTELEGRHFVAGLGG